MAELVTVEMFNGVFTEVKSLIPLVLPAVISFMAFRKGWNFIKSAIAGA